jgi:hypothetical protein
MWAENLLQNKTMVFAASALALLVAAVLILLIFRLVFGRRLRMAANGRTRMPRLGIVDAFDLDRNRQLVIVRRDNVEHLLMIGGPNDLVIESEIIRADSRDGRLREKESREKEPREAIQAGAPWPPEAEPARVPARPVAPERKAPAPLVAAAEPALPIVPDEPLPPLAPASAPQRPVFPLPPRRTPTFTPYAQRPQREPTSRSDVNQRAEPGSGPGNPPRAPLATPFLRPPPRVAQDAAKTPASPAPAAGGPSSDASPRSSDVVAETPVPQGQGTADSPAAPELSASAEAQPAAAPSSVPESLDGPSFAEIFKSAPDPFKAPAGQNPVDTLEEEMAKLLGRSQGK